MDTPASSRGASARAGACNDSARGGDRSRLLTTLALALALAASMLLAACGGSGSPASAAASEQSSEQTAETKLANFAKCMRDHGVKAEVGVAPGGGHALKIGPKPGAGGTPTSEGPATMEAAQKACARYQPQQKALNLSPQQKVEREEAVEKFARCMREHGINVQASASGGGIRIQLHGHPGSGPNPESPAFQQAQGTCQKLLPMPPGAGPGHAATKGSGKGQEGGFALGPGG